MNPEFLYAEDIGGSHIDVEVVDSGTSTVRNPDGDKAVIWLAFRGAKKRLGCGATLCKTMESICGTANYLEWRGWIRLAVIRGKFRDPTTGKIGPMDVIRIADDRPRPSPAPRSETISEQEKIEIMAAEAKSNNQTK